jgi:hypothetical protein
VPTTSTLAALVTRHTDAGWRSSSASSDGPSTASRGHGQIELHEDIALAGECRAAPTADTDDFETAFE